MAGPWEKYRTTAPAQQMPTQQAQPRVGQVFSLPPDPQQVFDNQRQTHNDAFSQDAERQRLALAKQAADRAAAAQQSSAQIQALAQRQSQMERARTQAQWKEFGNVINSLITQYNDNFKGNGGTKAGNGRSALSELLPGNMLGYTVNSSNDQFNSTAKRAGPFLKSVLFPSSKDTDAAAEYNQKIIPFLPQSSDSDQVIVDKIAQLRRIYDGQMRAIGITPKYGDLPQRKSQNRTIDFNDLP